jgi:uncharacterized protein YecE (DUF72 family)
MVPKLKIGCCGFPVTRDKYFDAFDMVELQRPFYQPPENNIIEGLRDAAPEGFEFSLKAWQLITHEPKSPTYRELKQKIPESKAENYGSFKPTDEVFAAWDRTREIAKILNATHVVFRCPPSFVPSSGNKRNLEMFFSSILRQKIVLAWEPGGNWEASDVKAICKDLHLVHVVDPFRARSEYGGMRYYRLHGIGDEKYKYTAKNLTTLKKLAIKRKNAYFMFNNTRMYDDAMALKELLAAE